MALALRGRERRRNRGWPRYRRHVRRFVGRRRNRRSELVSLKFVQIRPSSVRHSTHLIANDHLPRGRYSTRRRRLRILPERLSNGVLHVVLAAVAHHMHLGHQRANKRARLQVGLSTVLQLLGATEEPNSFPIVARLLDVSEHDLRNEITRLYGIILRFALPAIRDRCDDEADGRSRDGDYHRP